MRKLVAILPMFCLGFVLNAQDSHFSNFQNTPLYYNPAATGILKQDDFRFTNAHRRQWKKIVTPARSMNIGFDAPLFRYKAMRLKSSFAGVGFNAITDRFGSAGSGVAQIDLSFMGAVRTDRQIFSVGVAVGSGTRRFDPTNLTWDSQFNGRKYDPDLPTFEQNSGMLKAKYLNLSAGFMWTIEGDNGFRSLAGVSVSHLNEPDVSFEGSGEEILHQKITGHWKAEIPVIIPGMTRFGVNPHVLFSQQGPYAELIAGASLKVYFLEPAEMTLYRGEDAIEVGAAYRYGDAIVLLTNYHHDNFNIGLSYDITTSNLRNAVNYRGGLELSFTWYGKIRNPYTRRGR